jgi:hypothetical protein
MADQQTGLSRPQPTLSKKSKIVMALTQANCFRGAEPTKTYLQLFSARLEQENQEYLFEALDILGERERSEGEGMLLDLASILREIRLLTPRKKTQYEQDAEELFAEQRKAREQAIGN